MHFRRRENVLESPDRRSPSEHREHIVLVAGRLPECSRRLGVFTWRLRWVQGYASTAQSSACRPETTRAAAWRRSSTLDGSWDTVLWCCFWLLFKSVGLDGRRCLVTETESKRGDFALLASFLRKLLPRIWLDGFTHIGKFATWSLTGGLTGSTAHYFSSIWFFPSLVKNIAMRLWDGRHGDCK